MGHGGPPVEAHWGPSKSPPSGRHTIGESSPTEPPGAPLRRAPTCCAKASSPTQRRPCRRGSEGTPMSLCRGVCPCPRGESALVAQHELHGVKQHARILSHGAAGEDASTRQLGGPRTTTPSSHPVVACPPGDSPKRATPPCGQGLAMLWGFSAVGEQPVVALAPN
eukprot:2180125-Alexandrium_andersonii.AAC.1